MPLSKPNFFLFSVAFPTAHMVRIRPQKKTQFTVCCCSCSLPQGGRKCSQNLHNLCAFCCCCRQAYDLVFSTRTTTHYSLPDKRPGRSFTYGYDMLSEAFIVYLVFIIVILNNFTVGELSIL